MSFDKAFFVFGAGGVRAIDAPPGYGWDYCERTVSVAITRREAASTSQYARRFDVSQTVVIDAYDCGECRFTEAERRAAVPE
ncbi:MAG: hypothetical protein HY899_18700 [Deltaproteobacteria bacterium]|nr:hypothetical protein [Deltaproteobacteria bacterium]